MTEKEELFYKECFKHKHYDSIDEYKIDIIKLLILSSWHYTEEQAKEIVISEKRHILECFEREETVSYVVADIGYCCG